jgi:two-component system chemotaxis sensor kinase CheA
MAQDPYKYFRLEARELLDQLSKGALELEKAGGDQAQVQKLLRLAHTLKGAARVVRQQEIAGRAHAIEEDLSPFREGHGQVGSTEIESILKHIDVIGQAVQVLLPAKEAEPATANTAANIAMPDESFRTVRADIAEMDAVLDGISETHSLLIGLRNATQDLESAEHLVDLLIAQLASSGGREMQSAAPSGLSKLASIAEDLRKRFNRFDRLLGTTVDQMDRELRQLREATEQLRLVSAGTLFNTFERTIRDAAQALSKQVRFVGSGGDIRLDSHVIETLQSALIQIVRNAVAHGIEPGSERRAIGKNEMGSVTVDVLQRGRKIVFRCHDDGRGLNLEDVRRVAQKRGMATGEAGQYSSEDLLRLLLRGGISTANTVTDVAGRGIGLDIVRDAVSRLSGDVVVTTESGKGTTFEIIVPASLASLDALLIESADTVAAIPLDAVRTTLRLTAEDISREALNATIPYNGQAIPFQPLTMSLNGTKSAADRNWTTVVLGNEPELVAIGVDRLLGTARTVVRQMPVLTPSSEIIAGMFLDSEGNPQLVLDPDGLVEQIRCSDAGWLAADLPRHTILVIDDSLTTRMLEQSILETAGYDVDVAQSAEEALEKTRQRPYGLFLVDVEMPGIDGYTFIQRIRADPALHHIPAILVTSRAAPEDRQRGVDVGAQGYLVKSGFNQSELLTLIKKLLG